MPQRTHGAPSDQSSIRYFHDASLIPGVAGDFEQNGFQTSRVAISNEWRAVPSHRTPSHCIQNRRALACSASQSLTESMTTNRGKWSKRHHADLQQRVIFPVTTACAACAGHSVWGTPGSRRCLRLLCGGDFFSVAAPETDRRSRAAIESATSGAVSGIRL